MTMTNFSSSLFAARPRSPENVKVSEVTPTSVRLSWSYPANPTEVQYYVIQYKPKLASWDYKEVLLDFISLNHTN